MPADAPVFPEPAEVHPGLRPFLDAADIPSAERWLDADRDAARPVCRRRHKEDAILERHLGLKAAGAGKLAVREPRLADAALVPA